ncbi:ROK family transcriptional regulator [uncultured Paraglaciecola sp.]|uniref:ROK family transcriptional regulator n=1 Tax=uncultured Paraglaciecola sp. TaxID=1765024 RepID=UPI002631A59D|nr:ROK family transcriptional regulator [uncultured Paraglaciecola sp.]
MSSFFRDSLITAKYWDLKDKALVSAGEAGILGILLRDKSATQADLTNALTFSQQSVSRMLSALDNKGMIKKSSLKNTGARGQPSATFSLNSHYAYSVGISLKADGLCLVLSDFSGETLDTLVPIVSDMGRNKIVTSVKESIDILLANNGVDKTNLFGVGLSTSGFHTGINEASYNTPESLQDFALINLEELFGKELGLPVWSENDGNAATIAENYCGVGNQVQSFAYFYFATGLGGGVVANGKLFRGVNGNAGEFRAILPIDDMPPPTMENLRLHLNSLGSHFNSVEALVDNYDDHLEGVGSWIKEVLPSLSLMVSATAAVLDTELLVFGGVVPGKLKTRMITQLQFFDINRRGIRRKTAEVVASEVKGDAAAIGASFLPFINKFYYS